MERICPVCNGMENLVVPCRSCGSMMADMGTARDYFGPYSPYEEIALPALRSRVGLFSSGRCAHFLECAECGCHSTKFVDRVTI